MILSLLATAGIGMAQSTFSSSIDLESGDIYQGFWLEDCDLEFDEEIDGYGNEISLDTMFFENGGLIVFQESMTAEVITGGLDWYWLKSESMELDLDSLDVELEQEFDVGAYSSDLNISKIWATDVDTFYQETIHTEVGDGWIWKYAHYDDEYDYYAYLWGEGLTFDFAWYVPIPE